MSDADLRLRLDALGRLVATLPGDGGEVTGVVPVRCFPFTGPDEHVSLCDEQGREVYAIPSMAALRPEVRALIERELSRREFVPEIRKILFVTEGSEPTYWDVLTDRGPARFVLVSEDHIRRMGPDGALLSDAHGVRYRIASIRHLDKHSRRLLGRYL